MCTGDRISLTHRRGNHWSFVARNECVTTSKNPATNIILFHVIQYEDDFDICLSFHSSSCNIQKRVSISTDHWEVWLNQEDILTYPKDREIPSSTFHFSHKMYSNVESFKKREGLAIGWVNISRGKPWGKNTPCHDHHEFISATFGECPNTKPTMYLVRSIARSLHFGCNVTLFHMSN